MSSSVAEALSVSFRDEQALISAEAMMARRHHSGCVQATGSSRMVVTLVNPDCQPRWRPDASALWCVHGDITLLLSLETGRYHTLDETAGAIWRSIVTGDDLRDAAREISRDTGVDSDTILHDICELVTDLAARQLVHPLASTPLTTHRRVWRQARRRSTVRAETPRVPSVMRCLCRLALVHVLLKTIGLRRVLRHIAATTSPSGTAFPSATMPARLAVAVGRARAWYPLRAACLERSVCLLWLIRLAGSDATLRIGVQPFPVSAHAWIECDGRILNDSEEHVALFKAFPAISIDES